jgi:hypothetical protein
MKDTQQANKAGSVMLQDLSCHVFGARFIPTLVFDSTTESWPAFYLGCLYVPVERRRVVSKGLGTGQDACIRICSRGSFEVAETDSNQILFADSNPITLQHELSVLVGRVLSVPRIGESSHTKYEVSDIVTTGDNLRNQYDTMMSANDRLVQFCRLSRTYRSV